MDCQRRARLKERPNNPSHPPVSSVNSKSTLPVAALPRPAGVPLHYEIKLSTRATCTRQRLAGEGRSGPWLAKSTRSLGRISEVVGSRLKPGLERSHCMTSLPQPDDLASLVLRTGFNDDPARAVR